MHAFVDFRAYRRRHAIKFSISTITLVLHIEYEPSDLQYSGELHEATSKASKPVLLLFLFVYN